MNGELLYSLLSLSQNCFCALRSVFFYSPIVFRAEMLLQAFTFAFAKEQRYDQNDRNAAMTNKTMSLVSIASLPFHSDADMSTGDARCKAASPKIPSPSESVTLDRCQQGSAPGSPVGTLETTLTSRH